MSKRAGLGMITVAWLIILVMATAAIDEWLTTRQNPNRNPQGFEDGHQRSVLLSANSQHQYVTRARINGQPVTLLVDTGASAVVIPEAIANTLRLPRGGQHDAMTANGRVRVTSTQIDEIALGPIVLRNVAAMINPAMSGDTPALLGMSALKTIELRQRDGELELIQTVPRY